MQAGGIERLEEELNVHAKATMWAREKSAQKTVMADFYMGSNDRDQV